MNVQELIERLKDLEPDKPVKLIVSDFVTQKQGDLEEVFDEPSAVIICGDETK